VLVVVLVVVLGLVSQSRISVAEVLGQFGNPEEGECPPLEAVTKKLVKAVTEVTNVCVRMICKGQ
jgi:hypothetical protein